MKNPTGLRSPFVQLLNDGMDFHRLLTNLLRPNLLPFTYLFRHIYCKWKDRLWKEKDTWRFFFAGAGVLIFGGNEDWSGSCTWMLQGFIDEYLINLTITKPTSSGDTLRHHIIELLLKKTPLNDTQPPVPHIRQGKTISTVSITADPPSAPPLCRSNARRRHTPPWAAGDEATSTGTIKRSIIETLAITWPAAVCKGNRSRKRAEQRLKGK